MRCLPGSPVNRRGSARRRISAHPRQEANAGRTDPRQPVRMGQRESVAMASTSRQTARRWVWRRNGHLSEASFHEHACGARECRTSWAHGGWQYPLVRKMRRVRLGIVVTRAPGGTQGRRPAACLTAAAVASKFTLRRSPPMPVALAVARAAAAGWRQQPAREFGGSRPRKCKAEEQRERENTTLREPSP